MTNQRAFTLQSHSFITPDGGLIVIHYIVDGQHDQFRGSLCDYDDQSVCLSHV